MLAYFGKGFIKNIENFIGKYCGCWQLRVYYLNTFIWNRNLKFPSWFAVCTLMLKVCSSIARASNIGLIAQLTKPWGIEKSSENARTKTENKLYNSNISCPSDVFSILSLLPGGKIIIFKTCKRLSRQQILPLRPTRCRFWQKYQLQNWECGSNIW